MVYKVTNKVNGKVYIGMSKYGLQERKSRHVRDSETPMNYFHRALRKYKEEDFIWSIIDKCKTDVYDDLREMEVAWIAYYDSFRNGYNSTYGGEGNHGLAISEETRKRMSDAQKGKKLTNETKRRISESRKGDKNHNYGKSMSKEVKEKLSKILKGRVMSDETKAKMSMGQIKRFESGCKIHTAKLTEIEVFEIRELYNSGDYTQKEISELYNITRANVSKIITYKTWKN